MPDTAFSQDQAAAQSVIEAAFNYIEPIASGEKPYRRMDPPGPGQLETNAIYTPIPMPVHDLRQTDGQQTLDKEGFALVNAPSVIQNFEDEGAIRTAYYAQSEAIVAQATGAARVITFDHTIRRAIPGADRTPVARVHNDYTEKSGPQRVRDLMGAEAEDLLKGRFVIVNLWRPIGHMVEDAPLAIASATSVPPKDFIEQDLIYADRVGETTLVQHSDEHHWVYLSKQTPDEAILIKCFDSAKDGRARFTAHSAFFDPNAPENARPRESIEIRTLVFFDD